MTYYNDIKIFHFRDKIPSLPREVAQITSPIHIRIKPTNVCGHSCWYCAYRYDPVQLGKDMIVRDFIPKEKMAEIIEDIVEMKVKAVTFSGGGEPFQYPFLLETVKTLAQTSVQFASLTNGSRLKGEVAEIFAHHGTWIRVSIDGWDDKSYAAYRGVREGEFSKILSNLEAFKKISTKCKLGISFIIDQKNAPHCYDFVKQLKEIGADSIKLSPCIVSDDHEKNNEYHKVYLENLKEQIRVIKESLEDPSFEVHDATPTLEKQFFTKSYTWCPFIQILPVIGADLHIYSCQDKAYNLEEGKIGSIKDKRFIDFWFSDKNKFFTIDPSKHCNHHCVAHKKNELILEYLSLDQRHLPFV